MEATEIQIEDLEKIHEVLAMCLTLTTALDIQSAQLGCKTLKPSSLTGQIEQVKERVDGLIGDWLFEQRSQARRDKLEEGGYIEIGEDEEATEGTEEELPQHPFGEFKPPVLRPPVRVDPGYLQSDDEGIIVIE